MSQSAIEEWPYARQCTVVDGVYRLLEIVFGSRMAIAFFLFAGLKCDVGVITFQTSDGRIANPGLLLLHGAAEVWMVLSMDHICCTLYCIDPLHKSMHKKLN